MIKFLNILWRKQKHSGISVLHLERSRITELYCI